MTAKLQYGGSFASTETQTQKIRIVDEINYPKFLEVQIANPLGNRSTTYSPYDEVRVIDDDVAGDPVIFRGRIDKISTPTGGSSGQTVTFTARDNLAELSTMAFDNATYSENGTDAVINAIIRGHAKTIGATGIDLPAVNSNTADFETSLRVGAVTVTGKDNTGTVLETLRRLAYEDPWASTYATTENNGWHFYLDGDNDLHYHRVGNYPSAPVGNGLAVTYGLASASVTDYTKQMLAGSSFDEIADDIVTEIRCHYMLGAEHKILRLKRFTHGTVGGSGYPFHANDEILGLTSGEVAKVQLVTSGALLVSHVDEGDNEVAYGDDFTAGETLIVTKVDRDGDGAYSNGAGTGGSDDEIGHASSSPAYKYSVASGAAGHGDSSHDTTAGASATFTTTPDLEINQKRIYELNLTDLVFSNKADATARQVVSEIASAYLRSGFIDISANTHSKGTIQILRYPTFIRGGVTTVVRAGNQIYVTNNIDASVAANYTVSKTDFLQSGNSTRATLSITDTNGQPSRPTRIERVASQAKTASMIAITEGGSGAGVLLSKGTDSGHTPTTAYGIFRTSTDGGGGSADTLGFLSGQTVATPAAATSQSSFWTMLSEPNAATTPDGSSLIFEPIVDYGGTNNVMNRAFIGYHNPLFATYSYYLNGGDGSAAFPSHSFYSDVNTGMYLNGADNIGFSLNGVMRFGMTTSTFYPAVTNSYDLGYNDGGGGTDFDFRNIYSVNALSVSSDRRLKEDIQPTNLGLSFVNDLTPVSYKWKKKHDDIMDQKHYGLIAQDVVDVLKNHGIDSLEDFGGILHNGNPEQMYKAKYEHFIPILIKAVQELSTEVKELKEKN